jgi:hypothetical protein
LADELDLEEREPEKHRANAGVQSWLPEDALRPDHFLKTVAKEIAGRYAAAGRPVKQHVRFRLVQFWWGDRAVHYEISIHERKRQLELGLHFESSAERNQSYYREFSRLFLDVQYTLGDGIWLEQWDKGWVRAYETVPLLPLDDGRVYAIAGRMIEIMDCLQPILEQVESDFTHGSA